MDTDDLVYCSKCGVYCNMYIVRKKQTSYERWYNQFGWDCPVCKHENYEG